MRKTVLLSFALVLLLSCSNSTTKFNNPFIPNYAFSTTLNLNLPTYSGLNSNINPQIIPDNGIGVTLIVMKISDTDYRAWDANCPNQYPSSCSQMRINGVNAKCNCDNFEYSLFTGVGNDGDYIMKPYRVQVIEPKLIRIYN